MSWPSSTGWTLTQHSRRCSPPGLRGLVRAPCSFQGDSVPLTMLLDTVTPAINSKTICSHIPLSLSGGKLRRNGSWEFWWWWWNELLQIQSTVITWKGSHSHSTNKKWVTDALLGTWGVTVSKTEKIKIPWSLYLGLGWGAILISAVKFLILWTLKLLAFGAV